MGACLIVNTRNMISTLSNLGYPINDTTLPTPLYNDNDACVKWCHNMTTKGNRHIKNRKNSTRKWVTDGTITVTHVAGKCNVSQASNYLKGIHYLALDIKDLCPTQPCPLPRWHNQLKLFLLTAPASWMLCCYTPVGIPPLPYPASPPLVAIFFHDLHIPLICRLL
jgi:hypothetical protein